MTFKIETADSGVRGFGLLLDLDSRSYGLVLWKWSFIVELS